MITDALLSLSAQQDLSGTGAVNSTNVIDLASTPTAGIPGAANQATDFFAGKELAVSVLVTTAFAGGTSLQVQAVLSASATLSSPQVIGGTGPIPVASLVAGARLAITPGRAPPGAPLRYFGLLFTRTGTFTAGAVTADLLEDYADGSTIFKTNNPIT